MEPDSDDVNITPQPQAQAQVSEEGAAITTTTTNIDSSSPPDSQPHQSKLEELSSEKAALASQLAEEVHLRRYTEHVLDARQQELELQEHQMSSKLDALKKELADAQRQLAEANDHIFRLQPQRSDITESEAKDAYKDLCANVQRWVENRLRFALNELDNGRLRTRTAPPQASRFVGFLREASRRCLNVDQSDEYHVIGIIMNYLWLAIFSKSFYAPLDDTQPDGTVMWIDELESSMSRLPRDAAHCREWRSETLTALTSQPIFKKRRERHLNLIADDLTALLSIFPSKTSPTELRASVRQSIIEPAANLAHRLHLAPSIYSLKWPARAAPTRIEVYECLNLASGGLILDVAGTTKDSPSRRNVTYLFDVCPGLFVERVEAGKKLGLRAIVKPTVLVNKADGDLPRKPTLVRWLWDSATPLPQHGRASSSRTSGPKSKPAHFGHLSKL